MARFVSSLLLLLWVIASSPTAAVGHTAKDSANASGFHLPPISGHYPGKTFTFESDDARRLTQELIPIISSQTTRVTVREDISLPIGVSVGITIDVTLKVKSSNDTICEERHAYISFVRDAPYNAKNLNLTIKQGEVTDHHYYSLIWRNRYTSLAGKASSPETADEGCRSLAVDTAAWRQASNASDFLQEQKRLATFVSAIQSLPVQKIHCIGPDGSPARIVAWTWRPLQEACPHNNPNPSTFRQRERPPYITTSVMTMRSVSTMWQYCA